MRQRVASIALVVAAGLALAACGSDETGDDANPGGVADPASIPTAAQLDNRSFVSTAVDGHDLVEGTEITLMFEADEMGATGGCNTLSGGFLIDENALTAGPFAQTMMACDEALMDQDTWLNDFLSDLPRIALIGSTLELTGGDVTMTLEEDGAP